MRGRWEENLPEFPKTIHNEYSSRIHRLLEKYTIVVELNSIKSFINAQEEDRKSVVNFLKNRGFDTIDNGLYALKEDDYFIKIKST